MPAPNSPATGPEALPGLARRLREDAPVVVITLALFAVTAMFLLRVGAHYRFESVPFNAELYGVAIAVLFVPHLLIQLVKERPDSPIRFVRQRYLSRGAYRDHLLAALPILAVQISLLPFFSTMKSTIPVFHPYNWDHTFITADKILFLGHDPWRILQPILGFPIVTSVLSVFYHLWIALNYLGCAWLLFAQIDSTLRRRFFLCFALSWSLIGGVMATMLASYGPCFLAPLAGDHYYAEQMAYLRAANEHFPVMTLKVQDLLVSQFHAKANGLGSGISAMPSMHIAIAFLFWLVSREVGPRLGRFFFAFFVTIWIASVHLAYHYAVDGLVAVIAISLLWRFSAWFFAWWDSRSWLDVAQPTLRTNTVPAE